jgi:hypothetical protein
MTSRESEEKTWYGPPTEDEIEDIRYNRFTESEAFRVALFEKRLMRRYGMEPSVHGSSVYYYEALREDIAEHRARIRELEKKLHSLKEMQDWIEPFYREAIEEDTEEELQKIMGATPDAITDGARRTNPADEE